MTAWECRYSRYLMWNGTCQISSDWSELSQFRSIIHVPNFHARNWNLDLNALPLPSFRTILYFNRPVPNPFLGRRSFADLSGRVLPFPKAWFTPKEKKKRLKTIMWRIRGNQSRRGATISPFFKLLCWSRTGRCSSYRSNALFNRQTNTQPTPSLPPTYVFTLIRSLRQHKWRFNIKRVSPKGW